MAEQYDFIVYGFLLNLSISDLFIAGVFPGMLMVLAMMLAAWFVSKRNNWGHIIKFDARKTAKAATRRFRASTRCSTPCCRRRR